MLMWCVRSRKCHEDSQDGWTALIQASVNGHTDCARLLIEAGADKEAKDNVRAGRVLSLRFMFMHLILFLLCWQHLYLFIFSLYFLLPAFHFIFTVYSILFDVSASGFVTQLFGLCSCFV